MATDDTPRLVVAVSGGVDSVVLLDKLACQSGIELVVAHFDHGIRTDSADDARFVENLAKKYQLPFETRREELGNEASEEYARTRRYLFLREVAHTYDAKIVTAHHADDIVETIAINLIRGTGWRGLAVLDSDIVRPLLGYTKQELLDYATKHHLEWQEDSTNATDAYLRNRLRHKIAATFSGDEKRQLCALRASQVALKHAIEQEATTILTDQKEYSRYFFTSITETVADELLRAICLRHLGTAPTRPGRQRALLAIKTAKPGTRYHIATGTELCIERQFFTIQAIK